MTKSIYIILLDLMKSLEILELKKEQNTHKVYIEQLVENAEEHHKYFIKKSSDNFVFGSDNCSEAIASSIAEFENKNPGEYKGMVSGFGKGVAGNAETCGALLTGISFISKLAFENGYDKKQIRVICNEFYQKFQEEFQSTKCKVLSGHDCDEPFSQDFDLHTCGKYLAYTTQEILKTFDKFKKIQQS